MMVEELPNTSDRSPVPETTVLTNQQILDEIANIHKITETRLAAIDLAVELLQRTTTSSLDDEKFLAVRKQIELSSETIRTLYDEKLNTIQVQFTERDMRAEQINNDNKMAVSAALQAAKEAVIEQNKSAALAIAKSETSIMTQMDQIKSLITSPFNILNDKIDDIKLRLSLIEDGSKGVGNFWSYLGSIGVSVVISTVILLLMQKYVP